MWREEGFRGFMKGNGINVVRVSDWSGSVGSLVMGAVGVIRGLGS